MRRLVLGCICAALLVVPRLSADCVSLTAFGTAYTQDFNTLASSGTSSTVPAGWAFAETGTNNNLTYTAGTGSGNAGDTYSFGSSGSSERAFGGLLSGSLVPTVGACFQNNTGGTITSLDIAYTGEEWRFGATGRRDRLDFQYSTDATSLATGGWTNVDPLDFSTPNTPATTGALDGNAAANRTAIASSIASLSIPSGASFWIRWSDFNASGADDGLSVDDFSLTANGTASSTPSLTIADVPQFDEGDSGTKTITFTVSVNPAPASDVTFDIATADGTAAAPADYVARSVSGATIAAGQSTYTFDVTVNGDTDVENDESFFVNVSNVSGANVIDGQALTTIRNDDVAPPPSAAHVVISQIYGGGGNSNARYKYDYVELYNPTALPVDITGWSVQYASATGTTWVKSLPLAGTVEAGKYYLINLGSGGVNGGENPAANIYAEISAEFNLGSTAGKIALVDNAAILSDPCPVSSTHVVDLVGYGATANCREGSAAAPAPSNSNAIFRKGDGAIDTNDNAADFVAGAADARRTASIIDLPPVVIGADPASRGTDAPRDASVTLTFSEPVSLAAGWYDVSCAETASHADATVAQVRIDARTYVITPNVNFKSGEQCTVTVFKTAVHDLDGTSYDPPAIDSVWKFTTSTGTLPAYPADVHLAMGNPSGASLADPDNFLMLKPEFAISYNRHKATPNWVSWHLSDEWTGSLPRNDTFRPDPQVPPDWYRVLHTDFVLTGFDRGHMCPNADRDKETSIPINQATFLMSNMVPQAPDNNQGPWAALENDLRKLLPANELYIVAGPQGIGGTGRDPNDPTGNSSYYAETVAGGNVTVPAKTWKVALVLPKGDGDLQRVSAATRTIAVIMPNTQGIRNDDWKKYLVTVRDVEQLTSYNFFSSLGEAVQNSIERGKYTDAQNPPGAGNGTASTPEDTPGSVTLDAVSPSGSLTYSILTQPSNGTLSGSGASLTYTPAPDFNGTDGFSFQASDGLRDSNVATVTITVREVNDPPVAVNDSRTTDEDTALTFAASELTANDAAGPANENAQSLTVAAVMADAGTHGSVALDGTQVTYTPEPNYNGPASFRYRLCDDGVTDGRPDVQCAEGTVVLTVSAVNDPPFPTASTVSTATEGSAVSAVATATDVDDTVFTYAWNVTKNGAPYATGSGSAFTFTPDDNGTYLVTVVASDPAGATGSDAKTVSVTNLPPVVSAVSAPSPLTAGTAAVVTVTYSDAGTADTHTALFMWDDGTSSAAACSSGTCAGSHLFAGPGVYTVGVVVTDDDGGSASAAFTSIVLVDPNAGSVTGGGWIAGASGKASFSVNARYLKGAPTGQTQFQVPSSKLDFHSTAYDWLVVAGSKAQYAGTGTINGAGSYGFVLTAADDAVDQFRIRIWDRATGQTVFDTNPGAPDDLDLAAPQPIGGGSIVVH